jgi:hypothetical protein
MAKYGQKILFFFCRPCGEYHEKTHPHYRAMKRRKRKAAVARASAAVLETPVILTPKSP